MNRQQIGRLLALAAAGIALAPSAALAQSSAKPVPCDNLPAVEDSATDARIGFAGRYTPAAAEANQEILSFFWRQDPRGTSSRVLTANLVIKNLDKVVAPGSFGQTYRLFYTTDDGIDRFVEYYYNELLGSEGFRKGHFDPDTGALTSDGAGTGRVYPGPDGVISVELATGKSGVTKTLDEVRWVASTDRGAVIAESDRVAGMSWDGVSACDAPAPAATAARAATAKRKRALRRR